jgi:hypothetical protein
MLKRKIILLIVVSIFTKNGMGIEVSDSNVFELKKKEQMNTIPALAMEQLRAVKNIIRVIDSIGYDENAVRYFNGDYFLNKYQRYKKRIKEIKIPTENEWEELQRISDDLYQILPSIRSYRLIIALKDKNVPDIHFDSINLLTEIRKMQIENGDTVFNNNAELFYAFFIIVGASYKDSLLFRGKFIKSHLLYASLIHLSVINGKEEYKSQQLRPFVAMNEYEIQISMEWKDYFDRITKSLFGAIISDYTNCMFKCLHYNDTVCMASFFKIYSQKELSYFIRQVKKYHTCLDILNEYKCENIEELLKK